MKKIWTLVGSISHSRDPPVSRSFLSKIFRDSGEFSGNLLTLHFGHLNALYIFCEHTFQILCRYRSAQKANMCTTIGRWFHMSFNGKRRNKSKERIISDYLLTTIENILFQLSTLLASICYPCSACINWGTAGILVSSSCCAPAYYVICSDRVIPDFLEN